MPKSRPAPASDEPTKSPVHAARDAADALYRAAVECCHQHDRIARIAEKSDSEEELAGAQKMCEACHDALSKLIASYEETAASVVPTGGDEGWWHRANALWLASREYLRRSGGCDSAARNLKDHGPERLNGLHAEFELEASALLALKHAADAYERDRPAAA
jgi:hypothetical protein